MNTGGAILVPVGRDTELFRITFCYDENDRVLEQAVYCLGQLDQRARHTYNERGDKMATQLDDEPPGRYDYVYDERGNWTLQTFHSSAGAIETRRRITYYDQ